MSRRIAIVLAAAGLLCAASIPTDALAAMRGVGGGGFAARGAVGAPHSFAGRGFAGRGFAGRGFVGRGFAPGFRRHRFARFGAPFIGLGLGLGAYSYYDDACWVWTPFGYRWACGYNY